MADAEQTNRYYARAGGNGMYLFGYVGPSATIATGQTQTWQSQFYAGPKDQIRLEEIAPNLNLTVDYGFLWWLAVPLFYLLDMFYSWVGNWGVAIILLTIVVKGLSIPCPRLVTSPWPTCAGWRRR